MKILVCISNVADTTTKVKFTDGDTRLDPTGVQWIINPWDELALTRALELKDQGAVTEVDVVNVGSSVTEATLRKALATGADKAWRIDADPVDALQTAAVLAAWLKTQSYDIILSGVSSSDYNGGAMGAMLAVYMKLPSIAAVSKLDIIDGHARVHREIDGGQEVVDVTAPFLAIVQKGIAMEPRIPSMRGIMQARQKPLEVIATVLPPAKAEHLHFILPKPKGACKMIDPERPEELLRLLREEARVL